METLKEEPQMSIKTPLSFQSSSSALAMKKKKTPSINRSNNLWSTYLQQFQCYPAPLIPLNKTTVTCQLLQPSWLNYNPAPYCRSRSWIRRRWTWQRTPRWWREHTINALYKWAQRNAPQCLNFQNTWQAWGQCTQNPTNSQPLWQGFRQTPFNSTTAPRS